MISQEDLRKMRAIAESCRGSTKEAQIVIKNELERIQTSTQIKTKDQLLEARTLLKEMKESQNFASQQRKERMISFDRVRTSQPRPTRQTRDNVHKEDTLLTRAQKQINEREDDVKQMNAMVAFTKVATVREW
jgi:hypothetical protein